MGTSDPGLTEAGETGVAAGPLLDGCETPLVGGFSTPDLADGMSSRQADETGVDAGLGSSVIQAPPSPGLGCPPAPPSPGLGCGQGPSPPGSPPTPPCSVEQVVHAVAAAFHPSALGPGSAPATPVQTHPAPGIPSSPVIVASPDHFALPAPAVVAPSMSPSRSAPPLVTEDAAEPPVPPVPLVPPAVAPALPYRRHKAGISAVQVAVSGNSKCRACDSKIAYKSVRFEYWWMKNRPPGYVHPECVVTLAADALELSHDLDFLRPVEDDLIAAVSAAKEALQRRPIPA